MNLKQLKERGGIVDAAPVKKEIRWQRVDAITGEEQEDVFEINVLRLSFGLVEQAVQVSTESKTKNRKRVMKALLMSESVLLGDNLDEPLPFEDAYQLKPSLGYAIYRAVAEVNGLPVPPPPKDDDDDSETEEPTSPKA